jgi:hypothetical protein
VLFLISLLSKPPDDLAELRHALSVEYIRVTQQEQQHKPPVMSDYLIQVNRQELVQYNQYKQQEDVRDQLWRELYEAQQAMKGH